MPHLLQDMRVLQSSPIHSITEVVVHLSLDLNDKEVYNPESWKENEFALLKPGFMKLLSAAGMEEIPDQSFVKMVEDFVFYAKEVVKWTQPDGKDIILPGDKMFDLRIGGARWDKARESALDGYLMEWAKENNFLKKKKGRYDESNKDWCIRIIVEMEMREDCAERLKLIHKLAKETANREIRQKQQFGAELAQTGAIERAVKAQLGLKSTYTRQEIEEGFVILRSEYRWAMLAGWLGEDEA